MVLGGAGWHPGLEIPWSPRSGRPGGAVPEQVRQRAGRRIGWPTVGDATGVHVWTSAIPGSEFSWWMAAVGRRERTMSDHLGLPLSNQVRVGAPAWGAEVIPWGSTDALEAVKRICQEVTVRCHQAIATHRPADTSEPQVGTTT